MTRPAARVSSPFSGKTTRGKYRGQFRHTRVRLCESSSRIVRPITSPAHSDTAATRWRPKRPHDVPQGLHGVPLRCPTRASFRSSHPPPLLLARSDIVRMPIPPARTPPEPSPLLPIPLLSDNQVTLEFDLEEEYTVVTATSAFAPKPGSEGAPLVLDGRESFVDLLGVYVDDKPLSPSDYDLSKNAEDTRMTISPSRSPRVPSPSASSPASSPRITSSSAACTSPAATFCTQCERRGSPHHLLPRSPGRHVHLHHQDPRG